jgi:hypothetical protein
VGGIAFEVISATANSNKFQKTRFWKEKSVEDVVTLGPMAQATLVWMIQHVGEVSVNLFVFYNCILQSKQQPSPL